ncbi:hypothetical protein LOK49_Contig125G00010 [Camellia lanceoleosa]|nr:hypothetical protein LOK49_Contig125G00010 [Camellia lanceoleosa]
MDDEIDVSDFYMRKSIDFYKFEGINWLIHSVKIVKSLLNKKIKTDKNAENLEGRTAFDIATTIANPGGEAEREIKKALGNAGASKSSSLPKDYSFAKFCMSPHWNFEFNIVALFY